MATTLTPLLMEGQGQGVVTSTDNVEVKSSYFEKNDDSKTSNPGSNPNTVEETPKIEIRNLSSITDMDVGNSEEVIVEAEVTKNVKHVDFTTSDPLKYVRHLKTEVGHSSSFAKFEHFFFSQSEELRMVKKNNEQLRTLLSRCEEEKRSLQIQLATNETIHAEETRSLKLESEKNVISMNAQISTLKCEVDMYKHKKDCCNKEITLLKEHLKSVELEKLVALQKLDGQCGQSLGFDQFEKDVNMTLERMEAGISLLEKSSEELQKSKVQFETIMENAEKQMAQMNSQTLLMEKELTLSRNKITEVEKELVEVKAQLLVHGVSARQHKTFEESSSTLIAKLKQENLNLSTTLQTLTTSLGEDMKTADKEFTDKVTSFHDLVRDSSNRLRLSKKKDDK